MIKSLPQKKWFREIEQDFKWKIGHQSSKMRLQFGIKMISRLQDFHWQFSEGKHVNIAPDPKRANRDKR